MQLKPPGQVKRACERPPEPGSPQTGLRLWGGRAEWARPAGHQSLFAEMLREDFEKFGEPGGMSGPCRAGDKVAVCDGAGYVE